MCTWQTLLFAQGINDSDKFVYYTKEARKALNLKDYGFACDLLRHSLIYAETVEGGKFYKERKQMTDEVCQVNASTAMATLSNYLNSPACIAKRKAKDECAAAYDSDKCVQRKVGSNINFLCP